MKWRGRRQSSNIEDRRSEGGAPGGGFGGGFNSGGGFGRGGGVRLPIGRGRGGFSGIIGIIVLLGICWALGINPLTLLDDGTGSGGVSSQSYTRTAPAQNASQQQLADFVGVVVGDTEDMWTTWFKSQGKTYIAPKVVLFAQSTQSGCGVAQTASGPFYCPTDKKVYLDLAFYDQLRTQFGAPGDFAQAYVIAHEVGHHVQDLLGVLPKFNAARQTMSQDQANAMSVRVELQADCFAGVWANYEGQQDVLDNGDTEEAIHAANQIGDDTLQREFQGKVQPRNFTHGTSAQRMKWFKTGLAAGDPKACDTFSGSV